MKNAQKGFTTPLLIGIFVVIVIIGGSIYFYSKNKSQQKSQEPITNNQTISLTQIATTTNLIAGWKTYTNEKYGFQFEYPSIFSIKEDNSPKWETSDCNSGGERLASAKVLTMSYTPKNEVGIEYMNIFVTNLCNIGHFTNLQDGLSQYPNLSYVSTSTLLKNKKAFIVYNPGSYSIWFENDQVYIITINDYTKMKGIPVDILNQDLNKKFDNLILSTLHFNK